MPLSSIGTSGGGATGTFGNDDSTPTTQEAYGDGLAIVCGYFQTGAAGGTLGDGHARAQSLPGGVDTQAMRLIIYGDDGTGNNPSTTLVGVTDQRVMGAGAAPVWITFAGWTNFGGAPTLAANTKYWLGAWWGTMTGGGGGQISLLASDDAPSLIHGAGGITYSSTLNPVVGGWGAGGATRQYLLYFDFVTSGGSGMFSRRFK